MSKTTSKQKVDQLKEWLNWLSLTAKASYQKKRSAPKTKQSYSDKKKTYQ